MAVTLEQLQEREAAKADDATAAAAEQSAKEALAAAQAHADECAARRQQTQARLKAADQAILANMTNGEIRGLHPIDIPCLRRVGDTLEDGTLFSIHLDPPAQ